MCAPTTLRKLKGKIHGGSSRDHARPSGPISSRSAAHEPSLHAGFQLGGPTDQCDARTARLPPQDAVIWPAAFAACCELARPVMPSSSPARAPSIATACLLQCLVNSHCLWLLSCVVDACVVSCAWNCTLACVSCMVLGGSVYSHVNVSVNVAGSVARVSLKLYYSHVYSTASVAQKNDVKHLGHK